MAKKSIEVEDFTIHELIDWDLDEWPTRIRCQHEQSDDDQKWYIPQNTCKECNWSHVHDCNRWPKDKKYKGKRYCIVWGDGYQGEWVPDDGYCHKWTEREEYTEEEL